MQDMCNTLKIHLKNFGVENPESYDAMLKTSIVEVLADGESSFDFVENNCSYTINLINSGKPDIIEELNDIFLYTYLGNIGDDIVVLVRKYKIHKNWFYNFIFWR